MEAQKIKDFNGGFDEWSKWKNWTQCALIGSGFESVISSNEDEIIDEQKNRVVYSQLATSTCDGCAYFLVKQFEETQNGQAAWKALCDWYDGDVIKNETAESIQTKLEALKFHSGISASEYVNKFMTLSHELGKIDGEALSESHAVHLFLRNINNDDYKEMVIFLRSKETLKLSDCVTAVQKKREVIQHKIQRRA